MHPLKNSTHPQSLAPHTLFLWHLLLRMKYALRLLLPMERDLKTFGNC
jgi:hypothetical protein